MDVQSVYICRYYRFSIDLYNLLASEYGSKVLALKFYFYLKYKRARFGVCLTVHGINKQTVGLLCLSNLIVVNRSTALRVKIHCQFPHQPYTLHPVHCSPRSLYRINSLVGLSLAQCDQLCLYINGSIKRSSHEFTVTNQYILQITTSPTPVVLFSYKNWALAIYQYVTRSS